jgi:hypothetical protein
MYIIMRTEERDLFYDWRIDSSESLTLERERGVEGCNYKFGSFWWKSGDTRRKKHSFE